MKRIVIFFSAVILIIANVGLSQDIINETGKDGKFIVRDAEQKEALIIEDGNVGITGELSVENMPEGSSSNPYVVWDPADKKFKTATRVFSKVSPLSEPLDTKSWHSIGYGGVDDEGNEISASVQGTAAAWNQFDTDYGYIKLGPANANNGHIYTDRPNFVFNKPLYNITGEFGGLSTADLIFKTGSATRLQFVNATGYVGIGTTSPGSKLHVEDSQDASSNTPILIINNTAASGQNMLDFQENGTTLGRLRSAGGGAFHIEHKYGGDIRMSTNDEVRMTIKNDGKVGIGTISPEGALDVVSNTGALIVPRMTTTQRDAIANINGSIIYNTTSNAFNFYESGSWVTK